MIKHSSLYIRKHVDELQLNYSIVNPGPRNKSRSDTVGFLREVACMTAVPYFVGSALSNVPWLIQQLRTQRFESAIDVETGQELLKHA